MKKIRRISNYNTFFLFLISIIIISCDKQATLPEDAKPIHPRVVWTENPKNHSIISWTTLYESKDNIVHYDTVSRESIQEYSFSSMSVRSGKITMKAMDYKEGVPEGYYHHSELNELIPGTKYYFRLAGSGRNSDEYYFITADETDIIKLLAGGDSRLGTEKPRYAGRTPHIDRQKLKTLIGNLVSENEDIYAFVHGADYGTTADWRHLYWYFEDLENSITDDGRILPMIISMGNHDLQLGFFENFYLGDEINDDAFSYYYRTDINSKITLLTLNTEISVSGVQYKWLKEELPLAREGAEWLLVNYHKPAFPAAKDPDDYRFARVREHWVPLFEENNVDLVIESDGHTLKRTLPILNNRLDPEGIVYIGEGGLGAPLREPDTTRWFLKGGFAAKMYHVWMIIIENEVITLQAIDIDGHIADEYVIQK